MRARLDSLASDMARFGRGETVAPASTASAGGGAIGRLERAFADMAAGRLRAQADHERSAERLALVQAAAGIGTWEWDVGSGRVDWSEQVLDLFGLGPGEFGGTYADYMDRVHPEDRALVTARIEANLEQGGRYELEHRILLPDGRVRWVAAFGELIRDEAGAPLALLGGARDVTAEREAGAALRASEARLAEAQALAHLGSWELDLVGGALHWSDEIYRIFEVDRERFGASYEAFVALVPPEDRALVDAAYRSSVEQRTPYAVEHRLLLADARVKHVREVGRTAYDPDGRPLRSIGTVQDLTDLRRTEHALRETALRLRSVVTGAPIVLFALDRDGVFVLSEGQGLAALGLEPGEVVGRRALSLYADHPDVVADLRRALAGEAFAGLSHVGGRVYVVRYTPLRGADGAPGGLIGVALDDTERWQAHQELSRHRDHLEELVAERTARLAEQARIIDEIHDAVIATDLAGRVTTWNRGAERLFGYGAREMLGCSVARLHTRGRVLREEIIPPLRAAGRHEVEVDLVRRDGTPLVGHLSLALRYGADGEPTGMIGYTVDITERKRAERLLERRTQELQAANRELEAFSYSVSHDLRGPLRAVDGFSQALAEDYGDSLQGPGADYLSRIRASAQRMGELIDDLLKLSRVTRTDLTFSRVDLSVIVAEQTELLRAAHPGRRVEVQVEPALAAWGDANLLRTLMQNLLENAWKFTARRPDARIEIGRADTPEGPAFRVADNGAGFDMRYADKLFGAFQRLHRVDEFEGTGIGLATVQRIINRHGGRVWADAAVEQGARFYFQLPDAAGGPAVPQPGAAAAPRGASP